MEPTKSSRLLEEKRQVLKSVEQKLWGIEEKLCRNRAENDELKRKLQANEEDWVTLNNRHQQKLIEHDEKGKDFEYAQEWVVCLKSNISLVFSCPAVTSAIIKE